MLKYFLNILSLMGELDQSPILLILMNLLVKCLKTIQVNRLKNMLLLQVKAYLLCKNLMIQMQKKLQMKMLVLLTHCWITHRLKTEVLPLNLHLEKVVGLSVFFKIQIMNIFVFHVYFVDRGEEIIMIEKCLYIIVILLIGN